MTETVLVISGDFLTPYAARGVEQSLEVIAQATALRRTVNGDLVDISAPEFRKYRSIVTCTDQNVPAIDGVWPGQLVTVECVAELSYLTSGGSPARTVVSGSSRVDGAFTFYRPSLQMRIVSISTSVAETEAEIGWSLELEES